MQNFTPIGTTVAKICPSVTGQRKKTLAIYSSILMYCGTYRSLVTTSVCNYNTVAIISLPRDSSLAALSRNG